MKFSEITQEQWESLQPYLDTCLVPLTALQGNETPFEATEALENLRDFMLLVEAPFKGRVVTYPAFHFYVHTEEQYANTLNELCRRLRQVGFRYIILMSCDRRMASISIEEANLMLVPNEDDLEKERILVANAIQQMWEA